MALATGLGSGYSPVAPGTAGTVVAVPLAALLLTSAAGVQLAILAAAALVAVWSAGVAVARTGIKDPSIVVIDEVAGYLVAVALLPAGWPTLAAGFVLFRFFDITKPPPCRQAEALPGGLGVVADDLVAGLMANLALRGLCVAAKLSL